MRVRQRAQQHRADNAEDRAVRADAEREREQGDRRERRRAAQSAQRDANVLCEIAEAVALAARGKRAAAKRGDLRFDFIAVSERVGCGAARVGGAHSLRLELAGAQVEMQFDLAAHFVGCALGAARKMESAFHAVASG